MSRLLHRPRQRGTALLELALSLPILLTLVACMAFYGRILYNYQVAQKASHDAVRYLSSASQASLLNPQLVLKEQALVRAIANAALSDLNLNPQAISGPFIFIHCDDNDCVGNVLPTQVSVEVQMTVSKTSLSSFIPFVPYSTLRARNVMRYAGN